jgi:hypothetical protein
MCRFFCVFHAFKNKLTNSSSTNAVKVKFNEIRAGFCGSAIFRFSLLCSSMSEEIRGGVSLLKPLNAVHHFCDFWDFSKCVTCVGMCGASRFRLPIYMSSENYEQSFDIFFVSIFSSVAGKRPEKL